MSQTSSMITLRPQAPPDDASNALPNLVRRIATERDSLKNVTEAKLQEEIAHEAAGIENDQEAEDDDEDQPKDVATQQKELWAAKNELVQLLDQARNPIAMALDTTSFQLRDVAPQQANQTLSPFIKDNFKQGALGVDKLEPKKLTKEELEADQITATGWSLQNLNRSADMLLQSARNLYEEVEKETRYWQGVSEVKRKGWSIARIPRQRNTVGVKFGFSEAGPLFQSQGLAALRANEEGQIILDRGLMREHKHVCVRVEENGRIVGQSNGTEAAEDTSDIEGRIRQARDSLFEDELFYEMTCEARDLLAYDVKIVQNAIHVPLPPGPDSAARQLVISLEHDGDGDGNKPSTDAAANGQADATALACRVLLTHVYRQRFRRRSMPPKPLSSEKTTQATSHILRPIMNFTHHRAAVQSLTAFLSSLSRAFASAGLNLTHSSSQRDRPTAADTTPMESVVKSLSGPHLTVHTLTLDSAARGGEAMTLTIETETALSEPTYGTDFRIIPPSSTQDSEQGVVHAAHFSDLEGLLKYIRQRLCRQLVQDIAARYQKWKPTGGSVGELTEANVDETTVTKLRRLIVSVRQEKLILAGGFVWSNRKIMATAKTFAIWPGKEGQRSLFELVEIV